MNIYEKPSHTNIKAIEKNFRTFILEKKHPCLMAKSVFKADNYHLKTYAEMNSSQTAKLLLEDLENYIVQYDFESNHFESFIAVFPNDSFEDEITFEKNLWHLLQLLHDHDDCAWDPAVSDDPNDSNFSFSIKGEAFYIIGLHPKSSRLARQSLHPTLVFNLHWQFEHLREMGSYSKVKKKIRKRDKKRQGSINPVLKDFGKDSETKQYSGRAVEKDWKCPFHTKSQLV
ncbi:guanitoxin biosynthesis heme-dependent pre-guanitoxin N-hydroxylase GntA [Tamlana sp. 2_MG-2023]|uniref:guanitoxin biosynthesis heme-dependent pre-guanitoxin N-hydroxylase GntA n=1 Tax=unclassified Tamlana TaxID=2614803 RepID=UPI0026E3B62A|nr:MULTISPECIES: guanitoxin biosynthesis heme-dependent pre-guanitoxin N-hydroxylase GntA [unclassified Tamlana]MDO6760214.1 guanitoxin biosynthesis heme-dependent pre-guanitoxin N-hydroxylase GntA [Tamlana sp. 2_MG-2023]MDO6790088.1 guanitoxin biosynthesis heme-dependent pre-guanitoxin N-hydroxylase GntA [Tamlana sp. 1_MG-2023]